METCVDDNSYPIYRRRPPHEGGETFTNDRSLIVTNAYIVTYNRTIILVKYIFYSRTP